MLCWFSQMMVKYKDKKWYQLWCQRGEQWTRFSPVLSTRGSCFYSQHNTIHSALPQSPEDYSGVDAGRPDATEWKRKLSRISFNSTTSKTVHSEEKLDLSQTIGRALIYISHTLLFYSESGKTILQKMYLWWPDCNCSFPFSSLYGVCQTAMDSNEEKSLMKKMSV